MFPTRRNLAFPCLRARATRSTRRLAQHGCTKASQCDWSGSSHKLAPKLGEAPNSTRAAVPDFSARQELGARSPLVQQSRRRLPTGQLISASSSLRFTGTSNALSLPQFWGRDEARVPQVLEKGQVSVVCAVTISTHLSIRSQVQLRISSAASTSDSTERPIARIPDQ